MRYLYARIRRVSRSRPPFPCLGASLPHGCVDPAAASHSLRLCLHSSKILKTEVQKSRPCPARYKAITVLSVNPHPTTTRSTHIRTTHSLTHRHPYSTPTQPPLLTQHRQHHHHHALLHPPRRRPHHLRHVCSRSPESEPLQLPRPHEAQARDRDTPNFMPEHHGPRRVHP